MSFTTVNPYNQKPVKTYQLYSDDQVNEIIQAGYEKFLKFRGKKPASRSEKMLRVAKILLDKKQTYANQITLEMGKPISQSIGEIEKCAWLCEYYAKKAGYALQPETIDTEAQSSYILKEPTGLIFGIMPWNYPFWQVFRVMVPNVMLGNGVVIKHSPNTLGCAELISDIMDEAEFSPNTYSRIIIDINQVENVIANPLIKAVTFTGSTEAGRSVAALAGKYLKKSVLELGGSNALLVFEDADLEETAEICIKARFQNTGQSCIAGKRLLVQDSIYTKFIDKVKQKVRSLKVGSPNDHETYISVLAREDLAINLKKQLDKSIEMGAKLTLGGKQDKCFFQPTILENIKTNMPVFKEETFGPLMAIMPFQTEDEAVKLVNQSPYGLGASLFTKDEKRFDKISKQLEDGAVFMNEMVKSHPKLPFGGTKNSGYGRELGREGLIEFANIKTIYKK